MKHDDVCPHCAANLLGDVIPEHIQPGGQRYRRGLAVEIRGAYDGALFYACPDCYGTWHRWTAERNPRLWEAAEKYRAKFTTSMTEPDPC